MTTLGFIFSVFTFFLHVVSVFNYPNGKVMQSCGGMIPAHGHSSQSGAAHDISVSQMTFRSGDQIEGTMP